MNFLLYLLGRGHRGTFSRPGSRQVALTSAAAHVAEGDLAAALSALGAVGASGRTPFAEPLTPVDLLICGHLHLACGDTAAAHHDFSNGIDRLMDRIAGAEGAAPAGGTSIEQLLSRADDALRRGRYVRASEFLQQARSLLDILLAAHAGLLLVDVRHSGLAGLEGQVLSSLVPLAKLSDITLRLLARARLATHLSQSLRERQLREDLAPWAVSAPSIDNLLAAEHGRLTAAAGSHPGHAEMQYRLALAARASGHPEAAVAAFERTLALHPYHVASAARLVATERQMNRAARLDALERAFLVPAEALQTFGAFARAAASQAGFDRAADRLCLLAPDETKAAAARANLAFALSELALLDLTHEGWREPTAA
jgi:hypothetical protein